MLPESYEPYIGEETRILLSFAMKDGGHLFSQWLRNKLMLSLNYFSTNSIYLDTIALREHETEHNLVQVNTSAQQPAKTYVAPDRRFEKQEGFITIGAMNKDWNKSFLKAISETRVMIIVLTPDYTDSQWCIQEWKQFQEENKNRAAAKGTPIFGLVIRFSSEMDGTTGDNSNPINLDGMDVLTIPKVKTTGGSPTALRSDGTGWAISETSYQQVLETIRTYL
jgi:hypothetical protein